MNASPGPALATTGQLRQALLAVAADDAAALPWLDDDARRLALAATDELVYRPARPVVGEGSREVRQDFEICMDVPAASPLWRLAGQLEAMLARALVTTGPPLLAGPIWLDDLVVQRYARGALGMTAHRDHARYVGLVALVVLAGQGRFCLCADRAGHGEREVPAPPGHLLLMRAPGFAGRSERPFHFVDRITAARVILGLRQVRAPQSGSGW